LKRSAREQINWMEKHPQTSTSAIDIWALSKGYQENIPIEEHSLTAAAISPIIIDNPDGHVNIMNKVLEDETSIGILLEDSIQGFIPLMMRPLPFIYNIHTKEDVTWSFLDINHPYQWDQSMSSNGNLALKSIINKALISPLDQKERQELINMMNVERELILSAITVDKLPEVIEHNTEVAVALILNIRNTSHIDRYLSVLEHMDMSLQSMEVVNQLTSAVELPGAFLYQYINNCIDQCQKYRDKFTQQRMVRLVCVFISCLVRNKIVQVKELVPPSSYVQSFCIEHSKIREAASLFRLLKNLETPTTI